MKTLFIDRKAAEIQVEKGRVLVRTGDGCKPFSLPTQAVEVIVISADVRFSSTLVHQLTQEKITLVFINPRKSEASTITIGLMHNDAKRRLLQYKLISEDTARLCMAKQLIGQKVRMQKALLMRALKKRPDARLVLTGSISRLQQHIDQLPLATNLDSVRGMEGASAAAYFAAYQALFPPGLLFKRRNRRPPEDPVNVILSLTYTLLQAEAVRVLFATGFDPLLGLFHEPVFGRHSLACDLVELFRPLAERWIWRLFADEILRLEHFSFVPGADRPCMLGKRGREIYYQAYESKACKLRRLMRRVARQQLAALRAD